MVEIWGSSSHSVWTIATHAMDVCLAGNVTRFNLATRTLYVCNAVDTALCAFDTIDIRLVYWSKLPYKVWKLTDANLFETNRNGFYCNL